MIYPKINDAFFGLMTYIRLWKRKRISGMG